MIRIIITAEAYRVLRGQGSVDRLPAAKGGGYDLWLTKPVLARLKAARGFGESYSDVILRLAQEEAA